MLITTTGYRIATTVDEQFIACVEGFFEVSRPYTGNAHRFIDAGSSYITAVMCIFSADIYYPAVGNPYTV